MLGQMGVELAEGRQVRRAAAGQARRMFRGQSIRFACGVVFDDAAARHGSEPFTYVPLVETSASGQLRTAGRALRRGLEQTGAMADVDHGAQHGACVDAEDAPGKFLHAFVVDGFGDGAHGVSSRSTATECGLALDARGAQGSASSGDGPIV